MDPDKPPLAGKVALVTGAGRGLGREISLALAAQGASLVLAGRDPDQLAEVGRLALRPGLNQTLTRPLDLGEPDQTTALAEAAAQAFGGLDIVVHAAGRGRPGSFLEAGPEAVWAMLRTRVWGAWLVTRACLPLMAGRGGDVVFLAAVGQPDPAWAMRGVVLAGAEALAEALRQELGRDARWAGIRALTVRLHPPRSFPPERANGLAPLPSQRRARRELAETARRVALALTHPPEVAVRELVINAGEPGE